MPLLVHSGTYASGLRMSVAGTEAGYTHSIVVPAPAPPRGVRGLLVRLWLWLTGGPAEIEDEALAHQRRMAASEAWLQEAVAFGERIKSWPKPVVIFKRALAGDPDPYRLAKPKPKKAPKPYVLLPKPDWYGLPGLERQTMAYHTASTTAALSIWNVPGPVERDHPVGQIA